MAKLPKNIIQELWRQNAASICEEQTGERVKNDLARVDHIGQLLMQLPTGQHQMAWVKKNNVEIWLDYTCEGAAGYYIPGTNTVFLNAHTSDLQLVGVLSHELRHCWQDHNSFLPTVISDANSYLLKMRMIEADAAAVETQILSEIRVLDARYDFNLRQKVFLQSYDDVLKSKPQYAQGKEALYAGFVTWFGNTQNRDFYDERFLSTVEMAYRIGSHREIDCDLEYLKGTAYKVPPNILGLDVSQGKNMVHLGQAFNGVTDVNYLQEIADLVLKQDDFVLNMSKKNKTTLQRLKKHESSLRIKRQSVAVPYFLR